MLRDNLIFRSPEIIDKIIDYKKKNSYIDDEDKHKSLENLVLTNGFSKKDRLGKERGKKSDFERFYLDSIAQKLKKNNDQHSNIRKRRR